MVPAAKCARLFHVIAPPELVSVDALVAALASARPPVVLDVRWRLGGPSSVDAHRRSHIPGSVFVPLDAELSGTPGEGGRHPLPAPAALEGALRRAGIRAGDRVVVHDLGDGAAAARAWWLLRWAGVSAVAVLDGGWAAWTAAGAPVTAEPTEPEPGDVVVRPGGMPVLDAEAAARIAREGVLLDARAPERYRGELEPVDPVAGHIPGAVNAPTTGSTGPDGRLLPPEVLRERFAALGADGAVPVGAYCGSGITAAHTVLALAVAGVPAALYVGSWSQWVTDPERPMAVGPEPG
jgi:thiosulfate/3-mercaptopyruvate sulfurtransferase